MEKYSEYTDEELIELYRDGEEEVVEYLMEKYKNLVRSKANSMFILGGDTQDLVQEGMIGLFKAVRDYDAGRDACFYTFAQLCVSRNMFTAVQRSGRKKHAPLNYYVSIYGQDDMEQSGYGIGSIKDNPEDILIGKESLEQLEGAIETELSSFERQVIELRITGMGYDEISKILGRDSKSVDNALQRIKNKLRSILKQNKE